MLKSNKGITLVALVITIVVMLILAGISISLVIGDNGIFKQAKDSASEYNAAATDEAAKIENAEDELNGIWNTYGN